MEKAQDDDEDEGKKARKTKSIEEALKHGEELASEAKARVERFEELLKNKKFQN